MAPGSIASISSSSHSINTSPSGSSMPHGTDEPGPNYSKVRVGRRNPTMLRMVLEAMQARERHQGTSVVAIKVYILHKYPTVDATRFKYLLKRALDTGMSRGLLARPANSKAKGATGSFKLVPKHKKKKTGARGAADAKRTGKKPRGPKKDDTSEAKVEKAALQPGRGNKAFPCLGATLEKAPKKASKAPLKGAKAVQVPPSAGRLGQKSNVKHGGSRQGAAEAHGKTKAVGKRSKPMTSKVQNGVSSPTKKKTAVRGTSEMLVHGAETGPKTKALAPPQGAGLKAQPTHRARKTGTPENPQRPGLPTKASSFKVPNKTEAEI